MFRKLFIFFSEFFARTVYPNPPITLQCTFSLAGKRNGTVEYPIHLPFDAAFPAENPSHAVQGLSLPRPAHPPRNNKKKIMKKYGALSGAAYFGRSLYINVAQ
ncbi:MAG: hypothetical protein IJN83_07390 [Clostridia bacterium]|nr:hypothetical protein [Clostridia bacterium]